MCGIFGIYGHPEAGKIVNLGLYALQHRGQESAGIVVSDGRKLQGHRGLGLVPEVFTPDVLQFLQGYSAIGHVRYSTTGSTLLKNAQPFLAEYTRGPIAIAHNGNLTNTLKLKQELETQGTIFQSTMDTEVIVHLIAKGQGSFKAALFDALAQITGSYSLILLTADQMIGVRDPSGNRPLCLGKLNGAYVLASETCALDLIQAEYIREVEPGEIIFINKEGITTFKPFAKRQHAFCIFEFIYFARPDSRIFGKSVYLTRKNLGYNLAKEHPFKAELVLPIPDSGNCAALGYAEEMKLPFEIGIVRNHYIGRTFIQPSQPIRDFSVKVKLNPVREVLDGKEIVIIEDSIVRGTTSRTRVRTLREAGARKIHMGVSCPPLKAPCFYGIDFPTAEELIASSKSVEQIAEYLGLDSLGYLSLEGMLASMELPKEEFCTACFTGDYPLGKPAHSDKFRLEKIGFWDY